MNSKKTPSSPPRSPPSSNFSDTKELDRFLPIANVSRIMKKSLPPNAKISKEAKETLQQCVSEFISFITGEASDKCQREKRKTINGDDLLWAMTTLGFEDYVSPLKIYLSKYRDTEEEKHSLSDSKASSSAIHGGSGDSMLDFQRCFNGGGGFYNHHEMTEKSFKVVVNGGGIENGDHGNPSRAMAANLLHQGSGW